MARLRRAAALWARPLAAAAAAAFLAAGVWLGAGGVAGPAAAAFLLGRARARNGWRFVACATLLVVAAATAWGALLGGCFLAGLLLAELWQSEGLAARTALLALLAQTGLLAFLVLTPEVAPHIDGAAAGGAAAAWLAAGLAAVAVGCALAASAAARLAARANIQQSAATADPLLAALFAALCLAFLAAAALLSVGMPYPRAMLLATAGLCALLAVFALLASPFASAVSPRLMEHAFSLENPAQDWAARMSALAAKSEASADFVFAAMREFLTLAGVAGARWQEPQALNEAEAAAADAPVRAIGEKTRHKADLKTPPLNIVLFLRKRATPTQLFNYYLLARIVGEYWLAKRREERNRADNLVRAAHETGARLTHEIKNILHALAALTQAPSEAATLRQLPLLRERLQNTLSKLQTPAAPPAVAAAEEEAEAAATRAGAGLANARAWWAAAKERYACHAVEFCGEGEGVLPADVFAAALDNFIQNALAKKSETPNLRVVATLFNEAGSRRPALQTQDNGAAVAAETAKNLFARPVDSAGGFGVALYQAAAAAEAKGYAVVLENNEDGNVVFALKPKGGWRARRRAFL